MSQEPGVGGGAHHEVLHAVAELVDEQDGEVVHRLPKLDPVGETVLKSL